MQHHETIRKNQKDGCIQAVTQGRSAHCCSAMASMLQFRVECKKTKPGQAVYVVGSVPELGSWKVDQGGIRVDVCFFSMSRFLLAYARTRHIFDSGN